MGEFAFASQRPANSAARRIQETLDHWLYDRPFHRSIQSFIEDIATAIAGAARHWHSNAGGLEEWRKEKEERPATYARALRPRRWDRRLQLARNSREGAGQVGADRTQHGHRCNRDQSRADLRD